MLHPPVAPLEDVAPSRLTLLDDLDMTVAVPVSRPTASGVVLVRVAALTGANSLMNELVGEPIFETAEGVDDSRASGSSTACPRLSRRVATLRGFGESTRDVVPTENVVAVVLPASPRPRRPPE